MIASVMALMMIAAMYFLARIAAVHTVSYKEEATEQPIVEAQEKTIVIDAGHGGSDPGKVGVNGALEKDINLAIAQLLQKKLEQSGYQVVMTREDDKVLTDGDSEGKAADMRKRIEIINNSKADVLVSIHQNSFTSGDAKGPQVFYYDASIEGNKFATIMQEQLNTGMEVANPRQIKANDNYYLLKKSEITAIIVECGFLSNEEEASKLCDTDYQQKIADNIYLAICTYSSATQQR